MHNLMVVFSFSVLDRKHPFWANLVQKIKIVCVCCQFITQINSNMQNSIVAFNFSVLDRKLPFWANFVQKINCQFKLKFGTQNNSNIPNSMVVITFYVLDFRLETPLQGKQIKLFQLKPNQGPRLIRICRIQGWCSILYQKQPFFTVFANMQEQRH